MRIKKNVLDYSSLKNQNKDSYYSTYKSDITLKIANVT